MSTTNNTRHANAARMIDESDWHFHGSDDNDDVPRWMVVTCWSDDTATMYAGHFYPDRDMATGHLRRHMDYGDTPEYLMDLDTGEAHDILIETTFTVLDTFTGEWMNEDDEDDEVAA